MTEAHRRALEDVLEDMRRSPVPIDMPQIERALMAILEALVELEAMPPKS